MNYVHTRAGYVYCDIEDGLRINGGIWPARKYGAYGLLRDKIDQPQVLRAEDVAFLYEAVYQRELRQNITLHVIDKKIDNNELQYIWDRLNYMHKRLSGYLFSSVRISDIPEYPIEINNEGILTAIERHIQNGKCLDEDDFIRSAYPSYALYEYDIEVLFRNLSHVRCRYDYKLAKVASFSHDIHGISMFNPGYIPDNDRIIFFHCLYEYGIEIYESKTWGDTFDVESIAFHMGCIAAIKPRNNFVMMRWRVDYSEYLKINERNVIDRSEIREYLVPLRANWDALEERYILTVEEINGAIEKISRDMDIVIHRSYEVTGETDSYSQYYEITMSYDYTDGNAIAVRPFGSHTSLEEFSQL